MSTATITVPVREIAEMAKNGIKGIMKEKDKRWERRVDRFQEEINNSLFSFIKKRAFPTRESIEEYLKSSSVTRGNRLLVLSPYKRIYMPTEQLNLYNEIVQLADTSPDKEITMTLSDYNVLMTWKDDDSIS